jgi:hypothetical protein
MRVNTREPLDQHIITVLSAWRLRVVRRKPAEEQPLLAGFAGRSRAEIDAVGPVGGVDVSGSAISVAVWASTPTPSRQARTYYLTPFGTSPGTSALLSPVTSRTRARGVRLPRALWVRRLL